jgi:hypothetical protein
MNNIFNSAVIAISEFKSGLTAMTTKPVHDPQTINGEQLFDGSSE